MKFLGWNITKIKKERLVTFTKREGVISINFDGDGWGMIEQLDMRDILTEKIIGIQSVLGVDAKLETIVELLKLFTNDDYIKFVIKYENIA